MRIFLQWFGHPHTGKFAFFVSSIFPMHTYLKISSTTCGEEPNNLIKKYTFAIMLSVNSILMCFEQGRPIF